MQKLWLKDFEHHISSSTWAAADELVQAGRVKALREVERHFWVASVEDAEATYEVETIITPHKIKAFTCECWTEGRRLICPHIAAALLKIRQFLEQKQEERKAKAEARASTEHNRLTVGNVLDHAAPEALAEFVQEYARRDRDFALALKTWFAGAVSNTPNPFALVLDSVLPKNPADKTFREPDFRRLRNTIDDLNKQLSNIFEEQNFPTGFQLATTILQKINPLLSKLEGNRRLQLLQQSQQAFYHLAHLQDASVSPELREQAWRTVLEMAAQDIFPAEMSVPVLLFLTREATNDEKFEGISALFDQSPSPAPPFVLQLFLGALAQRNRPESVVRVLEEYTDQPTVVRDAIVTLTQAHHAEAAFQAGTHFLGKMKFSPGQRRELEDTMLSLARSSGDPVRQVNLLWQRFMQSGHFDFYEEAKTIAGRNWPAELKRRLAELRQKGDTRTAAVVLAAEGHKSELAELLEKQEDLRQFQQYENLFLPEDKPFVRGRYVDLLSAYLNEHFGRPASEHARAMLAGLMQKGEQTLVLDIIRALSAQFPDRPSLPEELAELFPKSKRKSLLQAPADKP
ncbi:MAG: hypothetical protein KF734_15700 [Saprospiraceae bacterium]|nr:hypothetical protein [Saprospiraceae bacterium]